MAEEAPADIKAIAPITDVKTEPNPMDGLDDLTMPLATAFKRPLDLSDTTPGPGDHDGLENDSKRLKTEAPAADEDDDPLFEFDMGLLVQNALSGFDSDLSGHNNSAPLDVMPTTEATPAPTPADVLRLDSVPAAEAPPAPPPPPPLAPRPAPIAFMPDPERFVRDANLNALTSLTITILAIAAHQPLEDILSKLRDRSSDLAQAVQKLKKAFEGAKSIYSSEPVIRPDQLDLRDADARTILQLANVAQLGAWIMDGNIQSMRYVDKFILPMLGDRDGGLSKTPLNVWVGIKTHLAMDSLLEKPAELSLEQILRPIYTDSITLRLSERRCESPLKDQKAEEITAAMKARQDEVQETVIPEGGLEIAKTKYTLEDIMGPFGTYAREQLATLSHLADKFGIAIPTSDSPPQETVPAQVHVPSPEPLHEPAPAPVPNTDTVDLSIDNMDDFALDDFFEKQTSGLVESTLAELLMAQNDDPAVGDNSLLNGNGLDSGLAHLQAAVEADGLKDAGDAHANGLMTDYKELEALVAESTSNYVRTTLQGLSPTPYAPVVPVSTAESMAAQSQQYANHVPNQQPHNPYYSSFQQAAPEPQPEQPPPEHLPPNQTASSSDLYDKARQAALSKTTAHTRREGSHSTRRPWSQEEEKALMTGLDMVKGPHWSQILTLFGINGTISDILKDRTQVQLKDKARNLKLFFLKTNSEMPFYLQAVTGELKTRAPTQAARKEAEERARMNSEEDQAKLQGIMALAGGLKHPEPRTSGSPGTANGASAMQTHAANAGQLSNQHTQHLNHSQGHPQMSTAQAQTAGQNRPVMQATTPQKSLQSIGQPPPRPQNQLPPQIPRPQTHAQPNTSSQAASVTQGAAQRPLQQNSVQNGAQQGTQQPTQTPPAKHPLVHQIQHQVQQRMAAHASNTAQAAAQRQQQLAASGASSTTANPSAGHTQQVRQQQQGQPKPGIPNTQANTQMRQPGTPTQAAQFSRPVQTPGQGNGPVQQRQGPPLSMTPSVQAAQAARAAQATQQTRSPGPPPLPRPPPALPRPPPQNMAPQTVSTTTPQPSQPAQPNQAIQHGQPAQHSQPPQPSQQQVQRTTPTPAQQSQTPTPQRQSPQIQQSPAQPAQTQTQTPQAPSPRVPTPQASVTQQAPPSQPAQSQPAQRPSPSAQTPQPQQQPNQTHTPQPTPQPLHQSQPSPAHQAPTPSPLPAQSQPEKTSSPPVQQQQQQQQSPPPPPQPQAPPPPNEETNHFDDDEASAEALLLKGLQDVIAGATAAFDNPT